MNINVKTQGIGTHAEVTYLCGLTLAKHMLLAWIEGWGWTFSAGFVIGEVGVVVKTNGIPFWGI